MTATDPTRVYQARGDAAVSDALAQRGPIAPVPYFEAATETTTHPMCQHPGCVFGCRGTTGADRFCADHIADIYLDDVDTAPFFTEGQRVDYHGFACAIKHLDGDRVDLRLAGHTHTDFWGVPVTALRPEPLIHTALPTTPTTARSAA